MAVIQQHKTSVTWKETDEPEKNLFSLESPAQRQPEVKTTPFCFLSIFLPPKPCLRRRKAQGCEHLVTEDKNTSEVLML